MCGRFTLAATPEVIQQAFNLETAPAELVPRYNIAPTQPVAVISNENPGKLDYFRWGLIPSWAKDPSIGSQMINARAETVDEKPSFKNAFKRRRCLIPADGFYEWGKSKVPTYIHLKDHEVFAFAGLWERWQSPDGGEIRTCTILTTTPNDLIQPLHHRMAVILDPADYALWLSPDELPPDLLKPLLRQYPQEQMALYPVSKYVNNAANEGPLCIEPEIPPGQQSLM